MQYAKLTDTYAVSEQIHPSDVDAIQAEGFATVICNRPDHEEPGQPSAAEIKSACDAAGIAFHHLPFAAMPIPAELIAAHREAIENSSGPVLAYCRSGQRSGLIWQAGN